MAMTEAASLTVGELEANYHLYCKAMKMLIMEERTSQEIQRTVCWSRLEKLHNCLPSMYKAPDYLFTLLRREHLQKKESK
jgi:hypothetical protein